MNACACRSIRFPYSASSGHFYSKIRSRVAKSLPGFQDANSAHTGFYRLPHSVVPFMPAAGMLPTWVRCTVLRGVPGEAPHSLLSHRCSFKIPPTSICVSSSSDPLSVISIILDGISWLTNRQRKILLPSLRSIKRYEAVIQARGTRANL